MSENPFPIFPYKSQGYSINIYIIIIYCIILDKHIQTSQLNKQVLWRYQGPQKVLLALKSSLEELSSSHLSEQQPLQ